MICTIKGCHLKNFFCFTYWQQNEVHIKVFISIHEKYVEVLEWNFQNQNFKAIEMTVCMYCKCYTLEETN